MRQTTWPAVGRARAGRIGSGLDVDRPVLPARPPGAAYHVQGACGAAAASIGVSDSTGAGVPAGAVGSTGGTSASAAGACSANSVSETIAQRRRLVVMVGTSLGGIADRRAGPTTDHTPPHRDR